MSDQSAPMADSSPAGQGRALIAAQNSGAGTVEAVPTIARPTLLPSAGAVIQAGAFGAALSGVTSAVTNAMLVKAGHMTTNEAVKDASKAAVQGAATMAIAATVAHAVRARPVIGLAVLAAAGIGLFMMMGEKKAKAAAPAKADDAASGNEPAPARRRTARKPA